MRRLQMASLLEWAILAPYSPLRRRAFGLDQSPVEPNPTRTFLWLGSDTAASNAQGQVEGKRIKFDKSFNEMEMLSLLKREFKEIGNAR